MDRLNRFTVPGISFFLTLWLFIYAMTGVNLLETPNREDNNNFDLFRIIIPILSTPIVGVMVTSCLHALFHIIPKKDVPAPYWLYLPKMIDDRVFEHLSETQLRPQGKNEWRIFYWNYQRFIRENLEKETIDFLTRRWTYCFIHYNNMFSIFAAIIISVIYFVYRRFACLYVDFNYTIFFISISILTIYFLAAFRLTFFALKDATNIECRSVLHKIIHPKKD